MAVKPRVSKSKVSASTRSLMEREYITPQQLADILGLSVKTIYNWISNGTSPRSSKFGGPVRFLATDVEDWLEEKRRAA